jgi:tetratricopeptide (TPR) repeat protein
MGAWRPRGRSWRALRSLVASLALAISLIGTHSAPASADDATQTEAEFLKSWNASRIFFEHSLSRKNQWTKDPLQGLVETHTDSTEQGVRVLRRLPTSGEDASSPGVYWLNRAIDLEEKGRGAESREAARLAAPWFMEDRSPEFDMLVGIHAVEDGNHATAEASLRMVSAEWPAIDAAEYDLALALLEDHRLGEAILVLESLRDRQLDAGLADYVRLLLARLYFFAGQPEEARRRLRDVDEQSPLHGWALWIEADDKLSNDRPTAALPFLLAHSERPSYEGNPLAQIALVETLARLGATRQATSIATKIAKEQMQIWNKQQPLAKKIASRAFLRRMLARYGGEPAPDHSDDLDHEARRLIGEIERTNSLRRLIEGNLVSIVAYQSLLKRGDRHLVSRLGGLRNQALHPATESSEETLAETTEVLWYEQLLSELVGQPQPRRRRYELLDGISTWRFGYPFNRAWWRGMAGSRQQTQQELERLLSENRELRSQHDGDAYVSRLLDYMNNAEEQGRRLVAELADEHEALGRHLAAALQRGTPMQQDAERLIYQLVVASLPADPTIGATRPEYEYALTGADRPGPRRLKDLRADEALIRTPIQSALNRYSVQHETMTWLANSARDVEIRARANHYVAYLAISSAERLAASESGDPKAIRRDLSKGIELYERMLEVDTLGLDRGEALYQLARARDLVGQSKKSLEALDVFADSFPDHRLAGEVFFRRGELRFSRGEYHLAAESYLALVETAPKSRFAEEADYKLGWSYYKLGEHLLALDRFFNLVARYWGARSVGGEDQNLLLGDTLRVISMTFANMGGIQSINDYFADRRGREYEEYIYQDLGHYYERKLRYSDAADAFRVLGDRFPSSPRAPYYQSRVISSYVEGEFPSRSWPARERFAEQFGVMSDYWSRADDPTRNEIRPLLEGYLQELARRDHAQGQSTASVDAYRNAISWYDQILLTTVDIDTRSEALFLRGEALSEVGDYEEAASSYEKASYGNSGYARGVESAYAALLSYQTLHQESLRAAAEGGDPSSHPDWLERGAEQSLRFIQHYPDAEQTPHVRTKLAEDRLLQQSYGEAIRIAEEQLHSPDQIDRTLSLRLWIVIAHASFAENHYAEAEAAYQRAYELELSEDERKILHVRRVESIYRQGELAGQAGDYATAVEHFERIDGLKPATNIHANARFDRATALIAMERWSEAVAVLESFRLDFPESPLEEQILGKLVLCYENTEQWDLAAEHLEAIYQREGDSALGRDALWRSAALYEKAGRPRDAERRYRHFIETFPEPLAPAVEARYRLALLAESKRDEKARRGWLTAIMEAQDRDSSGGTERTLYLASEASLTLGKEEKRRFDGIQLDLPLQRSLRSKQEAMTKSVDYLNKTLGYGLVDHGTEATALIADLYAQLAGDLMDSRRPPELNELELEQYEVLLEEQVYPFEERAIELYELNVSRIKDGVYDSWVEKSLEALRTMMPSRYGKTEMVESHVSALQ